MTTILATTDLSYNCDRAVTRAVALAKKAGAELHIVHVMKDGVMETPDGGGLVGQQKAQIEEYLGNYQNIADGISLTTSIEINNNAFAGILGYAKEHEVDFIVMGLHNKVGFKDLFVGTTIERVISQGVYPVLIVRDHDSNDYDGVIYGDDFSDAAEKSLCAALSVIDGADLTVVHTYDFPDTSIGDRIEIFSGDIIEKVEKEKFIKHKETVDKLVNDLNAKVKGTSYKLEKGNVHDVLMSQIEIKGRALLAIGGHSRSGIFRSKLGGTASELLSNPPCDVMVAT